MWKYYTNLPVLCLQLDQFRRDCVRDPEALELIDRLMEKVIAAYGENITVSELKNLSINQRNAGLKSGFTEEQKSDIIRRHENGEKLLSIAQSYNCSKSTIHKITGNHRL